MDGVVKKMTKLFNIKCLLGVHDWQYNPECSGYHEAFCAKCRRFFYFEDAEDSPQGRGQMPPPEIVRYW